MCVLAAPTITNSSSPSVNIVLNTSVGLFCSARQYPDKPHIEWTNLSGLAVASSDDFIVSNDGANVLHSTVSVNRVGRYICSIPNTQENKQIEVIARVSILSTTQDVNLGRDGTKLLVCEARAYPNYPSITWMAGNGSSISQRHADIRKDLSDGSYCQRSSITVRTTGNFTCRAEASGECQEKIISVVPGTLYTFKLCKVECLHIVLLVAAIRVTSTPQSTTKITSMAICKFSLIDVHVLINVA